MATIKSYTDLEQSRKLAEFLPLESADMYYACGAVVPDIMIGSKQDYRCYTMCWSLAALLNALPSIKIRGSKKIGYVVYYNKDITSNRCFDIIDACVEMIEKLHKLNLL